MIKKGLHSIKEVIRDFFMQFLSFSSTRIQLIYFTAFTWAMTHIYYGVLLPLVREISKLVFKYYSLPYEPISLDSTYANTILTSTDMAFAGMVIAYVASKWKTYSGKDKPPDSDEQRPVD